MPLFDRRTSSTLDQVPDGNSGCSGSGSVASPDAALTIPRSVVRYDDHAAGTSTRVAVCGEITADPDATAVLIGLGVSELSMAPPAIPATKPAVRTLSHTEARNLAHRALEQESAADVRALLSYRRNELAVDSDQ